MARAKVGYAAMLEQFGPQEVVGYSVEAEAAGFDGVVRLNDAQTGKLIKEFVGVPVAPPASSSAKK